MAINEGFWVYLILDWCRYADSAVDSHKLLDLAGSRCVHDHWISFVLLLTGVPDDKFGASVFCLQYDLE